VAEERVGIEVPLGVQGDDFAVTGQDERVDLCQGCIGIPEGLVEPLEHSASLRNRGGRHTNLAGQGIGIGIREASGGVDKDLVNFFGMAGRHLFDVHAPLGGAHDTDFLADAVSDHRDVEFFLNVGAFFDEQAADFLATGSSLVGHQLHAHDLFGVGLNLVQRFGDFDAATLAPPTGVDLGLHHPNWTT